MHIFIDRFHAMKAEPGDFTAAAHGATMPDVMDLWIWLDGLKSSVLFALTLPIFVAITLASIVTEIEHRLSCPPGDDGGPELSDIEARWLLSKDPQPEPMAALINPSSC